MDTTRRANDVARVLAGAGVLALLAWLGRLLSEPVAGWETVPHVGAVVVVALLGAAGVVRRDWRVTVAGAVALGFLGGWGTVGLVGLPAAILLLAAGLLEHELTGARPLFA